MLQDRPGDPLPVHVATVAAPNVRVDPLLALEAHLPMSPGSIEVGVGIERHVGIGHAPETKPVPPKLTDSTGVGTERLMEADHEAMRSGSGR